MNHEIGNYQDKGVKVTMVTNQKDRYLKHLYDEAVSRLMAGISPDADEALEQLKTAYPKRVKELIDDLMGNYTPEGIKEFETSFRKGFKKISVWSN